jgi:two-component system response regulator NreC
MPKDRLAAWILSDMSIRILLADDHGLLREGLRALFRREDDFEIVGEAEDGWEALRLAEFHKPDVLVLDVTLPELNGIEVTRRIVETCPEVKVLCLSDHIRRTYITEMLCAGAFGYLSKSCAFSELAYAIRTIVEDKLYVSPAIAGGLVEDYIERFAGDGWQDNRLLTPREREVLQLLAEGKGTKQIALFLHLSSKTIEAHRLQIKRKLRLDSLAELTKYAIREGLTTVES